MYSFFFFLMGLVWDIAPIWCFETVDQPTATGYAKKRSKYSESKQSRSQKFAKNPAKHPAPPVQTTKQNERARCDKADAPEAVLEIRVVLLWSLSILPSRKPSD